MNKIISTRRVFLQRGLTLLAASPTIPAFLDQTVMALAKPSMMSLTQQPSGKDGKILVVVQLAGGNDGLSTVDSLRRRCLSPRRAGDRALMPRAV